MTRLSKIEEVNKMFAEDVHNRPALSQWNLNKFSMNEPPMTINNLSTNALIFKGQNIP